MSFYQMSQPPKRNVCRLSAFPTWNTGILLILWLVSRSHLTSLIARTTQTTSENQQQSATELYAEVAWLQQSVREVPPADAATIWAVAETYRLGALLYIQCRLEGWTTHPPFF